MSKNNLFLRIIVFTLFLAGLTSSIELKAEEYSDDDMNEKNVCCNLKASFYNEYLEHDFRPRYIRSNTTGVSISMAGWFVKYDPEIDTSEAGLRFSATSTEVDNTVTDIKTSGPGEKISFFGNLPFVLFPKFVGSFEYDAGYSSVSLNGSREDFYDIDGGPKVLFNIYENMNLTAAALVNYQYLDAPNGRLKGFGFSIRPGVSFAAERFTFTFEASLFRKTGVFVSLAGTLF